MEARANEAAEREQRMAEDRRHWARERRKARRWKVAIYVLGAVIVAAIGFAWYSHRHVYHGPPGGTAECNDHSISYAAHHQGACSWHGGVYAWNG